MSTTASTPLLEDVLEWFALEADSHGALERYLRDYPQFAHALVDLSYELGREVDEEALLPASVETTIADAWQRCVAAAPQRTAANPFSGKAPSEMRALATDLGIPRQVLIAFREGAVLIESVPRRFLRRMANAIGSTLDKLLGDLAAPPMVPVRSYKAKDKKPVRKEPVSFERLLIDAQVPADKRAELLAEDD